MFFAKSPRHVPPLQSTAALRAMILTFMNIQIFPMLTIILSLLFSSCGEFEAQSSQQTGIHDVKTSQAQKLKATKTTNNFDRAKSPNGFHPAAVSADIIAKCKRYSKDKYGTPSYPRSKTHRVVRTTAYSHQENEKGAPWRKNALGTYLKYGKVRSAAADWSRYPVGTQFKIKGLPYTYIIDDYGSALVGTNTLDIYHPNLRSMRLWGTRNAEIKVIKWGSWEKTLAILKGRLKYSHTRKMYYAAKKNSGL